MSRMKLKHPLRAAVLVYSYIPGDVRVSREARALQGAGVEVFLICLRGEGERRREWVDGIDVLRIGIKHSRKGPLRYLLEYSLFILAALFALGLRGLRHRFHLLHVHNMPDVLVFSTLVPRLLGARVLLDLHDPMPELYCTKYGLDPAHSLIRALQRLERWCIAYADLVITPNRAFRKLFISRGCPRQKIFIVMNTPEERLFSTAAEHSGNGRGQEEKFTLMYHGLIAHRHGLDLALRALKAISRDFPLVRLEVFGEGDFSEQFQILLARWQLGHLVRYHGVLPLEAIPAKIQEADLGLIPNRLGPFTNLNLPTRIFEYLAMARPVVAPRTRGIQDYFPEDSLYYFQPGDPEDLTRVIRRAIADNGDRQRVVSRGMAIYRRHTWQQERKVFLKLALGLIGANP